MSCSSPNLSAKPAQSLRSPFSVAAKEFRKSKEPKINGAFKPGSQDMITPISRELAYWPRLDNLGCGGSPEAL